MAWENHVHIYSTFCETDDFIGNLLFVKVLSFKWKVGIVMKGLMFILGMYPDRIVKGGTSDELCLHNIRMCQHLVTYP